ncbi:hypothetical protein KY290_026126 [Solanum tuberosum]|uniref:Reverse transcriptase/retrotransposon-derived protein RNase H-like domain-containing protein n=1 Tax=Solanum tuberosum TaxID=4113 RepID=A0ABQ7UXJ3_SOLTU|nr:hypothetical protein KY284_024979 [Solanum tuberosum]KAH0755856.1 hypothetical protein KY290_026126 [Solanum tuberosum]
MIFGVGWVLSKDAFLWKEEATLAFEHLKQALISTLVLAMVDYRKPFLVETDASGKGVGVVLMQQGHPIAYISKSLAPKTSSYKALKYLLEQNIHIDFQVAGISKLMAFDFSIEYKKGAENKVGDALSRKLDAELLAISLLTPNDSLYEQIKGTWSADDNLQE